MQGGEMGGIGDPFDVQSDGIPSNEDHPEYDERDSGEQYLGITDFDFSDAVDMAPTDTTYTRNWQQWRPNEIPTYTSHQKASFYLQAAEEEPTDEDSPPMDSYEFQGLPVVIENSKGSTRSWTDSDGKSDETEMLYDYGFIDGYHGVDGDEVDVYIGPNEDAEWVYVIHQMQKPDFIEHDEDKVMMGFDDETAAKEPYISQYDNPDFYGGMTAMKLADFRKSLEANATKDDPSAITHMLGEALKTAAGQDLETMLGPRLDELKFDYPDLADQFDKALESVRQRLDKPKVLWRYVRWAADAIMESMHTLPLQSEEGNPKMYPKLEQYARDLRQVANQLKEGSMKTADNHTDLAGTRDTKMSPETKDTVGDGGMLHQKADDLPTGYQGDDDPVRVAMLEAGLGECTAVTKQAADEEYKCKKGDKVIYEPTGRTGKVTTISGTVATVEFDDDLNPNIRSVSCSDLKKASRNKGAAISLIKEMAKEALASKTADLDRQQIEGYDVTVTGNVGMKGKSGEVVSQTNEYVIVKIDGERYSFHKSDLSLTEDLDDETLATIKVAEPKGADEDGELDGKEAIFLDEGMMSYSQHLLIQADTDPRDEKDLPTTVIRQVVRELEDDLEERELSTEEEGEYTKLKNEDEKRIEARLDINKVAAAFDRELGLAQHEYYGTPPMHIGAEKMAADELGEDIFGEDQSYDYSPGERSISSIAVDHLIDNRPRLLADRSRLVNAAANTYRKVMKKLGPKVSVEQVALSKIAAKEVDEHSGTMLTGMLQWQVSLASHAHRRRAAVTLEMPVVAGEPVEAVTMITSTGQRLPFTLEAVDQVMNVRRENVSTGRAFSNVPLAHHFEY